jgi:hypothetical protein
MRPLGESRKRLTVIGRPLTGLRSRLGSGTDGYLLCAIPKKVTRRILRVGTIAICGERILRDGTIAMCGKIERETLIKTLG